MKVKVKLFDKKLFKRYLVIISIINLFCSFALIVIEVPDNLKVPLGLGLVVVLLIIYLVMWIMANYQIKATLRINNSTLEVKSGNIFEEDGLKVISFNQYFDTQVDNRIISDISLNGIYLKTHVNDINVLDNLLDSDVHLNEKVIDRNDSRPNGKRKIYRLGTIYQNEDYLLTAFSKFDNDNRAYLYMNDYVNFLLNFWNEIDIIYAGRSVSIPLMGSGITRFKEYDTISEQELLELLIWSFKISRIKFTYPSKVSIIIHKSKIDKINFYNLKEGGLKNGL